MFSHPSYGLGGEWPWWNTNNDSAKGGQVVSDEEMRKLLTAMGKRLTMTPRHDSSDCDDAEVGRRSETNKSNSGGRSTSPSLDGYDERHLLGNTLVDSSCENSSAEEEDGGNAEYGSGWAPASTPEGLGGAGAGCARVAEGRIREEDEKSHLRFTCLEMNGTKNANNGAIGDNTVWGSLPEASKSKSGKRHRNATAVAAQPTSLPRPQCRQPPTASVTAAQLAQTLNYPIPYAKYASDTAADAGGDGNVRESTSPHQSQNYFHPPPSNNTNSAAAASVKKSSEKQQLPLPPSTASFTSLNGGLAQGTAAVTGGLPAAATKQKKQSKKAKASGPQPAAPSNSCVYPMMGVGGQPPTPLNMLRFTPLPTMFTTPAAGQPPPEPFGHLQHSQASSAQQDRHRKKCSGEGGGSEVDGKLVAAPAPPPLTKSFAAAATSASATAKMGAKVLPKAVVSSSNTAPNSSGTTKPRRRARGGVKARQKAAAAAKLSSTTPTSAPSHLQQPSAASIATTTPIHIVHQHQQQTPASNPIAPAITAMGMEMSSMKFVKPSRQCLMWEISDHKYNRPFCPYWHPREICKYVPSCPFGAEICGFGHAFCSYKHYCQCQPPSKQFNHLKAPGTTEQRDAAEIREEKAFFEQQLLKSREFSSQCPPEGRSKHSRTVTAAAAKAPTEAPAARVTAGRFGLLADTNDNATSSENDESAAENATSISSNKKKPAEEKWTEVVRGKKKKELVQQQAVAIVVPRARAGAAATQGDNESVNSSDVGDEV